MIQSVSLMLAVVLSFAAQAEDSVFSNECASSPSLVSFVFAANSADSIMCTNDYPSSSATECFMGPRLPNLVKSEPSLISTEFCRVKLYEECAHVEKCHEVDQIFGGYREFCGHLGQYLDFIWRIKGLDRTEFDEQDGQFLCKKLSGLTQ